MAMNRRNESVVATGHLHVSLYLLSTHTASSLPSVHIHRTSPAISPTFVDDWQQAIAREHASLFKIKTWTLVASRKHMHVISCMSLYILKNWGPKVWVVVLGSGRSAGLNYDATFAPVVQFSYVRLFLATVDLQDLELHQMHVVIAFHNGDLDKSNYMSVPTGLVNQRRPHMARRLHKALYGRK